ncbi:hypothetical protein RRG08_022633 [Elysia crispata]|uniref:Uncharacterized protein n=1 Tax=Elysia crispata TaxID=231223 RepID=A0AAE1D9D5_9GAST|nr:hypothetical protein RRG08_022633 [Elysia crispata]
MEESELKGDKVSVRQTEGVAYGYKEGKDRSTWLTFRLVDTTSFDLYFWNGRSKSTHRPKDVKFTHMFGRSMILSLGDAPTFRLSGDVRAVPSILVDDTESGRRSDLQAERGCSGSTVYLGR